MDKNMMDYILETPGVLTDIVNNSKAYTKELVDFYIDNKYEGINIIASGSSYNGSLMAKYFLSQTLKMEINIYTPFNYLYHEPHDAKNKMNICISQSGCSTNTLNVLKELKSIGLKTVSIVGRDDCDAKDISDLTVNWRAGEEKVGFVTKGVTSLACFLMCFGVELSRSLNLNDEKEYKTLLEHLFSAMDNINPLVNKTKDIFEKYKEEFLNRNRVILLSAGPNYGTASEGALKIAETSCIDAFAYEVEEFLHGPLYPSKPDDIIILIDNDDSNDRKRIHDIGNALKDLTEKVYFVSQIDEGDKTFAAPKDIYSSISPIYKVSCLQTLAYLMTENSNQYEPDECVKTFKKNNKVASKSRDNLYLNLQKIK